MRKFKRHFKANFIFMFSYFFITACHHQDMSTEKKDLMESDIAMSALAREKGFSTALIHYAHQDFVKLAQGKYPIIGKTNFISSVKGSQDTKNISWYPLDAKVAKSGELGYTWGNWKFQLKDTVIYGNYFSAWEKTPDGNWQLLLDGGNSCPAPTK